MKADPAFRARSRAHSLLLSAAGTAIQAIANAYQVHRVTVSTWITKWERHGAQSLHDQPRSGRPSKLTPDERAIAQQYRLSGILRGVKLLYYQPLISTDRCSNILRSESSGAPDF